MLTRPAIARVLQSLMVAELTASRGRPDGDLPAAPAAAWPETLRIGDLTGTDDALGCDSLERLRLAAAANEMFHLHEADQDGGLLADPTFGNWIDRIEATWRGGANHLTFSTSGSTGRPKRCRHTIAHLLVETAFLSQRWQDRTRIVALVPAHHIYGFLFTALLPDALGIPCLDASLLGPADLRRSLRPGDLIVTFPERWHWLERSVGSWSTNVEGVVSTAPCPADLIQALCRAGLTRMTEVYGSTETAGIALRTWPDRTYRLMPHWRFASAFDEAEPVLVHTSGHRALLMDAVQRAEDDRFALAGRRDGMVQVGGVNVSPDRIAAQLRTRPGIAAAAVRLMRPQEGSRLKAFLVLKADSDAAAVTRELKLWISLNLPSPEQPKSLTIGSALPTGAIGKALDW